MRPSALAIVPALLLLTACSSEGDGVQGTDVVATPTSAAQVTRPLDAYLPTKEQQASWDKAVTIVTNDCLSRYGLEPMAVIRPSMLIDPSSSLPKFGYLDERFAAEWGYRNKPPEVPEGPVEPEKTKRDPKADDVAYGTVKAFAGRVVPEGGCVAEAMAKLTEGADMPVAPTGTTSEDELTNIVLNAKGESIRLVMQDQRFITMQRQWSDCMQESGYSYKNRAEAVEDPRWVDAQTPEALPEEIKTAVADARCQKKVNYLGVFDALVEDTDRESIEKNSERLKIVADVWKARLRNAADVIEKGAGA